MVVVFVFANLQIRQMSGVLLPTARAASDTEQQVSEVNLIREKLVQRLISLSPEASPAQETHD